MGFTCLYQTETGQVVDNMKKALQFPELALFKLKFDISGSKTRNKLLTLLITPYIIRCWLLKHA